MHRDRPVRWDGVAVERPTPVDEHLSVGELRQQVVDRILTSWVLNGDARRRFDALALIDEFGIRSALPVLQSALTRLEDAAGPSVRTDRAKLERIIAGLK